MSFSGAFLFKLPTAHISGVDLCVGVLSGFMRVESSCEFAFGVKISLLCGCCRHEPRVHV